MVYLFHSSSCFFPPFQRKDLPPPPPLVYAPSLFPNFYCWQLTSWCDQEVAFSLFFLNLIIVCFLYPLFTSYPSLCVSSHTAASRFPSQSHVHLNPPSKAMYLDAFFVSGKPAFYPRWFAIIPLKSSHEGLTEWKLRPTPPPPPPPPDPSLDLPNAHFRVASSGSSPSRPIMTSFSWNTTGRLEEKF